jgi:predicted NBD/HSP70 family sugar kinase
MRLEDITIFVTDLGGTKLRVRNAVATMDNGEVKLELGPNLFKEKEIPTRKITSSQYLNDKFDEALASYQENKHIYFFNSIAGRIDSKTGEIFPSNIKFPLDFPKHLRDKGFVVYDFNDLVAGATGLARVGPGREFNRLAVYNGGTGNNIAITQDGIVYTACEVGHVSENEDSGLFCGCGGVGHRELYASGSGAALMAKSFFIQTDNRVHPILQESLNRWNEYHSENIPMTALKTDNTLFREIVWEIEGGDIYMAYRQDKKLAKKEKRSIASPQREIRRIQKNAIAKQIGDIASNYNELDGMIIRGGLFTNFWNELTQPAIDRFRMNYNDYLHHSLKEFPILRKEIANDGMIGAGLVGIDQLINEGIISLP